MTLTVGSLFSGIGGLDLGLERAGMKVLWQVEIDEWCRAVLAKHWPDVPKYEDVRDVGAHNLAPIDVLAGGFPCQPISHAGKRRGQFDSRWLWPEFGRLVRELRPRYVFVENVVPLLGAYRCPDGCGGWMPAPCEEVLGDLAEDGYDARWVCIPASAVGAPHQRERIWIVAYARGERVPDIAQGVGPRGHIDGRGEGSLADSNGSGLEGRLVQPERAGERASGTGGLEDTDGGTVEPRRGRGRAPEAGELADAVVVGRERAGETRDGQRLSSDEGSRNGDATAVPDTDSESLGRIAESRRERGEGRIEPGMGRGADGLSEQLDAHRFPAPPGPQYDWEPPRVAIGVPNRSRRLKGLGNAVVPQVVEWIGRRIVEAEAEMNISPNTDSAKKEFSDRG